MSAVQLLISIAGLSGVFLACALTLIGVDKILEKRAAPSIAPAT